MAPTTAVRTYRHVVARARPPPLHVAEFGRGDRGLARPRIATGGRNLVLGAAGLAATVTGDEDAIVATMRRAIAEAYPDRGPDTEPYAVNAGASP